MKYSILLFIFITFSMTSQNQKKYSFDYLTEYVYEGESHGKYIKKNRMYLSNSKDDGYFASLFEKNDSIYGINFYDRNDLTHSYSEIKKIEFINAENMLVNSNTIHSRNVNHNSKYSDFKVLKDTIIDDKSVYRLLHSCDDLKKVKRKKIYSYEYFIMKDTRFHWSFTPFHIYYHKFKKNKKPRPRGFYNLKIIKNFKGEITGTETLIQIFAINKNILFTDFHNLIK